MNPILECIHALKDDMTNWRHDIHRHPEIAFHEQRTANLVAELLLSFGYEVHRGLAGTGIVGTLQCGSSSRRIGLRADMDALEIEEANTFNHCSTHKGKMHACGHDGHTAMLLGAAKYLADTRNFDGILHVIFQPAEENEGGARVMIEDGLFELFPVDEVYGMHNMPGLPIGQFAMRSGAFMAACDRVEIIIHGKGAHAGMPHTGVSAILCGAQVINSLQHVPTRLDPFDTALVSVTQVNAGESWNVIPDQMVIRASVRLFSTESREVVKAEIERVTAGATASYGASYTLKYIEGYPPLVNWEQQTQNAIATASALVGENNVNTEMKPVMGSEDFAFMLQEKPGAYIAIGNGDREGGCMLHNPHYDFNDEALPLGAAYWVTLAESRLAID